MNKRSWGVLLLILLLMLPLTGCWDHQEVEEEGFVVVIGLDKAKIKNHVDVTFQIANPQVGSSDRASAENEPASELITFTAPDFIAAREMASISATRQLTFQHTKILIVGEDLARSDEFFPMMSATIRDREIRRKMNILVSRERASDFIKNNKPKMETRPHKFYDLMMARWENTGLVPISDINHFFSRTEADAGVFMSTYGTTRLEKHRRNGEEDKYLPGELNTSQDNPTQIIGGAVFKDGKMIGTMTGEEVRITLMLRPELRVKRMVTSFKDPVNPQYRITARIYKEKNTKIKIDVSGPKPKVDVTLPVTLEVLSIPSYVDYVNNVKNQERLKKSIEDQINETMQKFIKKTQTEYGGDPFQWYLIARKQFWTIPQLQAYDWMKHYPQAQVTLHPHVTISKFGKQMRPPQIDKIKD